MSGRYTQTNRLRVLTLACWLELFDLIWHDLLGTRLMNATLAIIGDVLDARHEHAASSSAQVVGQQICRE